MKAAPRRWFSESDYFLVIPLNYGIELCQHLANFFSFRLSAPQHHSRINHVLMWRHLSRFKIIHLLSAALIPSIWELYNSLGQTVNTISSLKDSLIMVKMQPILLGNRQKSINNLSTTENQYYTQISLKYLVKYLTVNIYNYLK